MTSPQAYEKLQNVFDNFFFGDVKVAPDLEAKDVEEWDSLLHMSLILAVEDEFKIRFGVGEVESFQNVGDLVDLILAKAK
jgi:acyl carrier protein